MVEQKFIVKELRTTCHRTSYLKYLGVDKITSFILVVSIIASSIILIYILILPNTGESFTEFYILSPNGTASNYQTNLKVGEEGNVIINIVNHENENFTYRLEVKFNGTIIYEERISISHSGRWKTYFTFKPTKKGENQKLEFLLYKGQQRENYRTLHLWISII